MVLGLKGPAKGLGDVLIDDHPAEEMAAISDADLVSITLEEPSTPDDKEPTPPNDVGLNNNLNSSVNTPRQRSFTSNGSINSPQLGSASGSFTSTKEKKSAPPILMQPPASPSFLGTQVSQELSVGSFEVSKHADESVTGGDESSSSSSALSDVTTIRPRYARSAITQSEMDRSVIEKPPTMKERINEFLTDGPFFIVSMVFIVLSTLAFVLETVPELSADPDYGDPSRGCFWFVCEVVFVSFFTLEYVLKWASTGRDFFAFPFKVFNIIDFLAIAPFYLELAFNDFSQPCAGDYTSDGGVVNLRFVRIVRLARVFRVFRLARGNSPTTVLILTFRNSKDALMVPFFFLILGMIVFSSLMYLAEQGDYDPGDGRYYITDSKGFKAESTFTSIPDSLWWAIVTMTTVGYGDMTPKSDLGKAINSVTMIFGVLFFAMPIAIVGNEFTKAFETKKEKDVEDAAKQQAVNACAEKSRLETNTGRWGDRELKHFLLQFRDENCSVDDFMVLTKQEKVEGNEFMEPPAKLIPTHFNWQLFQGKPKKIASQLGTSDFFLRSPDASQFTGEYQRKPSVPAGNPEIHEVLSWDKWVRKDRLFVLASHNGYWVVSNFKAITIGKKQGKPKSVPTYPLLRSTDKHGGSLPSLRTKWLLFETRDSFKPSQAKLAPEKRHLVIHKEPNSYLDFIKFEDVEGNVVLTSSTDPTTNQFAGRRVVGFAYADELQEALYPFAKVFIEFAPRFTPDPSLIDLANTVHHIYRTQTPRIGAVKLAEKNTEMYTKDFVAQLYHHIGFGRLPTGFRSKAGLTITCGTEGETQFVFTSDSDLGVYGLGPSTVVPVYCVANQARNLDEPERRGAIGGELLVLAQNFYLNADRKRTQRVFLVTYRGTDVRFYSAYFPIEYLEVVSSGRNPAEEGLEGVQIDTFPNRGDGEGVPDYPDTTRERNIDNETNIAYPYTNHALELDAIDNPLRLLSVDTIMTPGLRAGMRIHAVNGIDVRNRKDLARELQAAADQQTSTLLTLSVEHDALDFLNPSERAPVIDLLQRMRQRVIKYLTEDLDDKLAFVPLQHETSFHRIGSRVSSVRSIRSMCF